MNGVGRGSSPTSEQLEEILRTGGMTSPAILPRPAPAAPLKPTIERRDERCWTRCTQTNARRALGREPHCRSLCYINFRRKVADMVPVAGLPGAYLAKDEPPAVVASRDERSDDEGLPAYRWKWLEGRYLYFARGKEAVTTHMSDMSSNSVDELKRRIDKSDTERRAKTASLTNEERAIRKATGLDTDESSERLVHLADAWSNSFRRLHAHIVRIYGPAIRNLQRLPSTFTDGTQKDTLALCWQKLTDGSAFRLVGQLAESTSNVYNQAAELRNRRNGGNGSPPALGPPPSPTDSSTPTPAA